MRSCLVLFALISAILFFPGCKNGPLEPTLGPLNVQATVSTDGSGLVTFLAKADQAVRYNYYFGEGLDDPFASPGGDATHTYSSTGTYSVSVVASSTSNSEATKTISVTIQVNELPVPGAGYTTPLTHSGMTLVWQDEFSNDALDKTAWNFETGPFNDELQYYKEENTLVQNGYLIIKAKVEKKEGKTYTSSRLTTQNKQSFNYGRVDIRALMPKGRGMFPALWMLGSSFSTVGWPKCGEIDIMETIGGGGRDSVCYGTAHWDNAGEHASYGGHRGLQDGHVLGDEFHVYSIIWSATKIEWYLDDKRYHVIDITPAELNELKGSFFFIFNVAVGGSWAGSPDGTTVFPQRMVVDYVRVFQ